MASHARFGRTARNGIMYGPPGLAYVYMVYGIHDCLNVVTEPVGSPAALLVRAVEPLAGIGEMRQARLDRELSRRRLDDDGRRRVAERLASMDDHGLAAGPGALTAAFGIDRSVNGLDLLDDSSPLRLVMAGSSDRPLVIRTTARIGVAYAGERWASVPWRFIDASSPVHAVHGS
jgi:DNA-3-methyladenine glycosylase